MNLRNNILADNRKINQTTDRLQHTNRIALQTEELGVDILVKLDSQNTQLENADAKLSRMWHFFRICLVVQYSHTVIIIITIIMTISRFQHVLFFIACSIWFHLHMCE